MKREKFLELVIAEINHIKTKATAKEISKLDFSTFNAKDGDDCVYGQMTGGCNTARARELYPKSLESIGFHYDEKQNPVRTFEDQDFRHGDNYTYLEVYLLIVGSSVHKNILGYLKGENELQIN